MRRYEMGDPNIDERIRRLAADAVAGHPHEHEDADLIAEMMVTILKLHRDDPDRGDLKLVNATLKELRYSFTVFHRYRHIRKLTVFGSARTPVDDPNYLLAAELGEVMTGDRHWMIITGAGPGTMEAANKGAGGEASFGVNIRLPFEDAANPYVDDARLINFKYFFTRKLVFVKESHAFALFPGGFGTQDETFELLTLTQTGKAPMHPIVLIEAPGTGYWGPWIDFVESTLVAQGMISPDDLGLFKLVTDTESAVREICSFYRNYDSQRYVDERLVLRMRQAPGPEALAALNDEFSDIVESGRIEVSPPTAAEAADQDRLHLERVTLHFDRRRHGRLRRLIDRLNEVETPEGTAVGC